MKQVEDHYSREGGLLSRIRQALKGAGLSEDALTTQDLAPLDQFHVRGHEATQDIARALQLKPGMTVLDIGSGVGGPARVLAETTGAKVIGIDLTREFVEAANWLTERTGLTDKVRFQQANALDLPFKDNSFDAVYTQHVAMNIENKPKLYAEAFRVLKPGGRLFLYDMMEGPEPGGPYFPVPWAQDNSTSFLATPEGVMVYLEAAGFTPVETRDHSATAVEWFLARKRSGGDAPPPLGLHLLLGDLFFESSKNQIRNFQDGRVVLWDMTALKPG